MIRQFYYKSKVLEKLNKLNNCLFILLQGTSDDTIAAVLATLNEVIKRNAEFSRALLEAGGVDRLVGITHQRTKYTPRVLKFAGN